MLSLTLKTKQKQWILRIGLKVLRFGPGVKNDSRRICTLNMAQIGMMKAGDELGMRVVTFNLHGFDTSQDYVLVLMQNYDIILLQEHMLRDADVHLLTMRGARFISFVVPATHDGGAERPIGGIANLVRDLICIIEDLSCSTNNRVNALLVEISGKKIVVFNVYLPCLSSLTLWNMIQKLKWVINIFIIR